MTNQTPTRNTGNCSPVKQLYQKLDFWKNRILEKRNFSMGGEMWGAPLFRPSDPIVWASERWQAHAKCRLTLTQL